MMNVGERVEGDGCKRTVERRINNWQNINESVS